MATSVMLRGEGGSVWEFALPLSETYADQVRRGRLQAADSKSAEALAASGVFAEPGAEADASEPAAEGPPPMVGRGSGRDAWASYAKSIGIDVPEGMKKADIVAAVKAAA